MLAKSEDGLGGDHFYHELADAASVDEAMENFLSRDRDHTVPDQWQAQVLARVRQRASVIYISDIPDEQVEKMHMIPAHSLGEAMDKAKIILGKDRVTVTAIPDGISVVVV